MRAMGVVRGRRQEVVRVHPRVIHDMHPTKVSAATTKKVEPRTSPNANV
jgi:hypothetical protein